MMCPYTYTYDKQPKLLHLGRYYMEGIEYFHSTTVVSWSSHQRYEHHEGRLGTLGLCSSIQTPHTILSQMSLVFLLWKARAVPLYLPDLSLSCHLLRHSFGLFQAVPPFWIVEYRFVFSTRPLSMFSCNGGVMFERKQIKARDGWWLNDRTTFYHNHNGACYACQPPGTTHLHPRHQRPTRPATSQFLPLCVFHLCTKYLLDIYWLNGGSSFPAKFDKMMIWYCLIFCLHLPLTTFIISFKRYFELIDLKRSSRSLTSIFFHLHSSPPRSPISTCQHPTTMKHYVSVEALRVFTTKTC